jgi:prefoldin subunit 5
VPPPKKPSRKSDQCKPIREQIEKVQQQILDIKDALRDPDIPQSIKARLKQELPRLQRLLSHLRAALSACNKLKDVRSLLR